MTHLDWALELNRVGQVAEAEEHSRAAGRHAALAFEKASRTPMPNGGVRTPA